LEYLLPYDGRSHLPTSGHFLKIEVRRMAANNRVPHGIGCSLTLHAETLLDDFFDKVERVLGEAGVVFEVVAENFDKVERVLGEAGVVFEVVAEKER
jgi:predicted urease superfamily metal-dependent hydrolase